MCISFTQSVARSWEDGRLGVELCGHASDEAGQGVRSASLDESMETALVRNRDFCVQVNSDERGQAKLRASAARISITARTHRHPPGVVLAQFHALSAKPIAGLHLRPTQNHQSDNHPVRSQPSLYASHTRGLGISEAVLPV